MLKQFILKQFAGHSLPTNCLGVIDNFLGSVAKWLSPLKNLSTKNWNLLYEKTHLRHKHHNLAAEWYHHNS